MDKLEYIKRCLQIAKLGLGQTKSNPMVGAVLVHKDKIIGEGYHQKFGEGHAEVNCFNSVRKENIALIKDATLFVNLEPCSHLGKTPPCVDLVLSKKVKKVILASVDIGKHVDGTGIQKLRQAGVDVEVGLLDAENQWLNRRFFTFHLKRRPYVILKFAQTKNGFFCPIEAAQKWISNSSSKKIVHKWRSEEQAILVGSNTFKIDKPRLNNREWTGNSPIIVLIDKYGDLNFNHLNSESKIIVFTKDNNQIDKNIVYIKIDIEANIFPQVLNTLHKLEIASILIEGGLKTLIPIIKSNYWDEARIITGAVEWKDGRNAPQFKNYKVVEERNLEGDHLKVIVNNQSV